MLRQLRKQDGYFTVEVTLVFTVVLFSLMLIIFLGIALYQQVALQSSVQLIASQGATMYTSGSTELATSQRSLASYKNHNPYIDFLDSSTKTMAESIIRSAIAKEANQKAVYNGSNNTTGAKIERKFVAQKVIVSASRDYTLPILSIANTFGLASPFKVDVSAAAPISDPVEKIRTADICVDALMYFDATRTVLEKLQGYKAKVVDFVNGIDIGKLGE